MTPATETGATAATPPATRAGSATPRPRLTVALGQCSSAGRKPVNQDFHGALIPDEPTLSLKGLAVVLADGISSSRVSALAAEMAVKAFLTDYYCTADSWTVKTAAGRVIQATNSWLFAETRRAIGTAEMDRGHVCTFDAVVLKSRQAHLFHVGDGRIWRLDGATLEQLTEDHRSVVTSALSHLARALGMAERIEVDYRALPLAVGDVLVLTTDGVHEFCPPRKMAELIRAHADDPDRAAAAIVDAALAAGSDDNLTVQILRVTGLPEGDGRDALALADALALPPPLEAGQLFEGWRLLRALHRSHRSHVWLVADAETGERAVLKLPGADMRDDRRALRRFAMEDWIARRIDSPHVLRPPPRRRASRVIHLVTEHVEGQTLAQWMIDNPRPDLETVRGIVEQIARGLRAFHRKEMLHRDLRPENVMIDRAGTVKIIDFGAVLVPGVTEGDDIRPGEVPGAIQYAAPEYFVGLPADPRADQFSLAVVTYQMLTGQLPYGAAVNRLRAPADLRRLRYRPARDRRPDLPEWIDGALARALHPDPNARYPALSEFLTDLRRPNPRYVSAPSRPLIERNPAALWRAVAVGLLVLLILQGLVLTG